MVAGLYGAPGERYEPTRLDFVKASFVPDSDVYVQIEPIRDPDPDVEMAHDLYVEVIIHYKKLNKTGQALTVNLTEMASTLAKFYVSYRAKEEDQEEDQEEDKEEELSVAHRP